MIFIVDINLYYIDTDGYHSQIHCLIFLVMAGSSYQIIIDNCNEVRFNRSISVYYCAQCHTGYYPSHPYATSCTRCMPGCSNCTSDVNCSSCWSGYFMNTTVSLPSCITCLPNCSTCNSQSRCTICKDGYFKDKTTYSQLDYCLSCSYKCSSCLYKDYCSSCESGYVRKWDTYNSNKSYCEYSSSSSSGTGRAFIIFFFFILIVALLIICCVLKKKKAQEFDPKYQTPDISSNYNNAPYMPAYPQQPAFPQQQPAYPQQHVYPQHNYQTNPFADPPPQNYYS